MTRVILLASAGLITVLGSGGCRRDDPTTREIRAALSSPDPSTSVAGARWELVRQIYGDRNYRALWLDGTKLAERTRELIETLCHADREGLRASDYRLADIRTGLERIRATGNPGPSLMAALDLQLTRSFLDYGGDLLAGKLDPKAVDNGWYIRARRAGIDSILRAALRKDDFDDMMEPLRPRQREYQELVRALESYRELQAKGGWATVAKGSRLGDQGPWVGTLRYRLQATGELQKAEGKPVYDDAVAKAVARFQERHGLPVANSVGPATLAALNVPIEFRIRQIELNLERYRWLPSEFGKRYILVNIPDYRLYAYDGGKERLTMRVIVGDEYGNATPVFADSMTYLVFRPQWDVPWRILVDEVIPKVRKDPYYLAKHSYELVDTARNEVIADPALIDWEDLDTTKIHFRVRQKSGAGNALGNVKFMFPNQYSIYLHDTPAGHLFDQTRRTLSHGCVRVEDPVKLAGYVLDGQKSWDEEKIRDAMAPSPNQADIMPVTVDLERPVPVYLVYLTAFVRDGVLHFREDPYGKDRQAMARMGVSRYPLGGPASADRTECAKLQELVR
jgi:murein L,D-transpeptidase YcbB/YkuD